MEKIDWFNRMKETLANAKPEEYFNGVWSDGEEILCNSEAEAIAVANLIEQLYAGQGEEVVVVTGVYEGNGSSVSPDAYSNKWYVTID